MMPDFDDGDPHMVPFKEQQKPERPDDAAILEAHARQFMRMIGEQK